MFNNATEWVEQTSFIWKLCLIHNTIFSDTFFVQITRALLVGNLSNVYRACSFFTISDLFCIDNAHAIGRKIWYTVYFKNAFHWSFFHHNLKMHGPSCKIIEDNVTSTKRTDTTDCSFVHCVQLWDPPTLPNHTQSSADTCAHISKCSTRSTE
jgi:hypothetical protein